MNNQICDSELIEQLISYVSELEQDLLFQELVESQLKKI